MTPTNTEGDPGKLKYLHDPNWAGKLFSDTRDLKIMPGTCELCVFGRGIHADGCAAFQEAEKRVRMVAGDCNAPNALLVPYRLKGVCG